MGLCHPAHTSHGNGELCKRPIYIHIWKDIHTYIYIHIWKETHYKDLQRSNDKTVFLQHTATQLQHAAAHCNARQDRVSYGCLPAQRGTDLWDALSCRVLQYNAACCSCGSCVAVCCSVLQYVAVRCRPIRCLILSDRFRQIRDWL